MFIRPPLEVVSDGTSDIFPPEEETKKPWVEKVRGHAEDVRSRLLEAAKNGRE